MEREEKILLLELIMRDIRGNWGWELEERIAKAIELSKELGFKEQLERLEWYLNEQLPKGERDGRYLRTNADNGGYEGLEDKHSLSYTFHDKSEEFKNVAGLILTAPDYRFEDWDK